MTATHTGVNRKCHEPSMCPRVIALLIRATLAPHKSVNAQNGKPSWNKIYREKTKHSLYPVSFFFEPLYTIKWVQQNYYVVYTSHEVFYFVLDWKELHGKAKCVHCVCILYVSQLLDLVSGYFFLWERAPFSLWIWSWVDPRTSYSTDLASVCGTVPATAVISRQGSHCFFCSFKTEPLQQ